MKTKVKKENNATILTLCGRLDSNTAPDFEKQVEDFLKSPTTHLIFDFNELDYISSAGLRVILNTAKAYRTLPFRFIACNMQDHVQEVFEISGFDTIISIYKTFNDSIAALDN